MRLSIHRHARKMTAGAPAAATPIDPAVLPQAARPAPAPRHDIDRVPITEVTQRKAATGINGAAYRAPNRTGLPDRLKAGVESLSGLSMDGVRVHFGSSEPQRFNAHAFTRGTDIHVAPGQERHLPHEAWHVVQQAQARVQPTIKLAGKAVNDDAGLEHEADTLGAASAARGANALPDGAQNHIAAVAAPPATSACMQRVIDITDVPFKGMYSKPTGKATKKLISDVQAKIGPQLARGWKSWIENVVAVSGTPDIYTSDAFLKELLKQYPAKEAEDVRPGFKSSVPMLAGINYELQTGMSRAKLKPAEQNLAVPHRTSFKYIKTRTDNYISGKENTTALYRWTDRFLKATRERRDLTAKLITDEDESEAYVEKVNKQIGEFKMARAQLQEDVESGAKLTLLSPTTQAFLSWANSIHGNVPDFGPHVGVNIQVSDRVHLNILKDGSMTPGSRAALDMSPEHGRGVALTSDEKYVVTTSGHKHKLADLAADDRKKIKARGTSATTIKSSDLESPS